MTILSGVNRRMEIDLRKPEGNAFNLLGIAQDWYKQMGKSKKETESLLAEMTSGDYENLIKIFDREFGMICDLIVPERYKDAISKERG